MPLAAHKAAALGFLVGAAYWPGMLSPAFVPRWGAIAVGVPLLLSIDPRALPAALRWVLLYVLAMALLATAWTSPDPLSGYLELFFFVTLALAFIAGANLDSMDGLMTGLGLALVPSTILAITQYAGWWSPLPQTSSPSGLFLNSAVLAEFAALMLVWSACRARWWIVVTAVIPLVLCNSRVAIIAAFIGLTAPFWPRSRWTATAIPLLMIVGVMALLAFFSLGAIGKLASAEHRVTVWIATVLHWRLFGNGLGWFNAAYPQEMVAHSDALQAVAEVGIGAFALIAIPVMAFMRQRGNHAERATFVAACCTVVVSFPMHFPASGFLVAALAGYLVSDRKPVPRIAHERGFDDGWFAAERAEARGSYPPHGGGGGTTVSVRSVYPHAAAGNPRQDQIDSAQAVDARAAAQGGA